MWATSEDEVREIVGRQMNLKSSPDYERANIGLGSKSMPTVLRSGPYRCFFYAGDHDEPRHVHIEREDKIAKFWLVPVRLQERWVSSC